jgi:hypothetical protein
MESLLIFIKTEEDGGGKREEEETGCTEPVSVEKLV